MNQKKNQYHDSHLPYRPVPAGIGGISERPGARQVKDWLLETGVAVVVEGVEGNWNSHW